ncbi:MAG: GNAT family protein [Anaerolineae bacterium]|nr:GNAT family protein [Anaerolineae bacterium]
METPQPPTLAGQRLLLRPVTPEDYPVLHRWETDVATLYLWQPQTALLGYEEFVERRRSGNQGLHVQLLVTEREGGQPVGTVFSFDVSLVNGYGSLGIYLEPGCVGRGLGVEAGYLFVGYLMAYYPLRKLYTDIYAYNERSLRLADRLGFVVEGTLRAHRWFDHRYWDLYKLALYREAWERFRAAYQP